MCRKKEKNLCAALEDFYVPHTVSPESIQGAVNRWRGAPYHLGRERELELGQPELERGSQSAGQRLERWQPGSFLTLFSFRARLVLGFFFFYFFY